MVADAGPAAIGALASALETGRVHMGSSPVGISALRGVDSRTASTVHRAFNDLQERDPQVIALALRTALTATERTAARSPEIGVVWTGPDAEGPLVRPTAKVMAEMLREVKSGGEVLLVGYSITAVDTTKQIFELLGEATARHAAVKVILHKDEEAKNRAQLLAGWDVTRPKPTIYTWEPQGTELAPYIKMHAKVLVVDRMSVLVTSANLSHHGLAENIEVGLRVRGPQASAIAERFQHLIAAGVLQEWGEE